MRWDRFFEDLEDQLASEWEAERAALESETERLRLSRLTLRERLVVLASDGADGGTPVFELIDGSTVAAVVSGVGADWIALAPTGARSGGALVPFSAVAGITLPLPLLLRTARGPAGPESGIGARATFGFVLRDLVRRRVPVTVRDAGGRAHAGTIDRAGADHIDLALHDPEAPRRAGEVRGYRVVPFAAIAGVALHAPG